MLPVSYVVLKSIVSTLVASVSALPPTYLLWPDAIFMAALVGPLAASCDATVGAARAQTSPVCIHSLVRLPSESVHSADGMMGNCMHTSSNRVGTYYLDSMFSNIYFYH